MAAEENQVRRDARGRVMPGSVLNPRGRPDNARNLLTTEFFHDLYSSWQESGRDVLRTLARDDPAAYARTVAGLMPREDKLAIETVRKLTVELLDGDMTEPLHGPRQNVIEGGLVIRNLAEPAAPDAPKASHGRFTRRLR
jgi:hypothetical protein